MTKHQIKGSRKPSDVASFSCITRFAAVVLTLFVGVTVSAAEPESVPGQYVIQLKESRSFYEGQNLEQIFSAKIIDQVRPDILVIQRNPAERSSVVLNELKSESMVERVEPNFIYRTVRAPNDPDYSKLWGLKNTGSKDTSGKDGTAGVDVNAELAWDITTGSREVIVSVIDTGVDYTHADLQNNIWVNEAEANGEPGVDDDGNGYIDDIHGYDFVNNDGDPMDDQGHGTHCSGTIGAEGNDEKGLVGVAWNVRIMGVKFLDSRGSGTLANAVKAIDYARKMGAKIHSNSWGGGGFSQILKDSIDATRDADQLFVAAAGNDGRNNDNVPAYPASYDTENIVSVAAIDNRGSLAYFSNHGVTTVDVAAPGVNIVSTTPGNAQASYSGTSMATPHVSGVAVLLYADNPNQTYAEVKERLIRYARPAASLSNKVLSGGIVDAYYALTGIEPPADPNDPSRWTGSMPYELSTPHPYTSNMNETYTITVPGAKRLAVHFSKFSTETGYDKVQFFDKTGKSVGIMSGANDNSYSPVVEGDTVVMVFTSDQSVNGYGFDVDRIAYEEAE